MDKMKLDNLIRRYTIHHEDESYIEMKDLQTTSEDFCKDEIILEKIEKSLKKDLNILLFMELKHRKKLKKKKNSTRSPVGMRLLFLFDTIISCFLKNNTKKDIVSKKNKKEILINPPKKVGGRIFNISFIIYIIILHLKKSQQFALSYGVKLVYHL